MPARKKAVRGRKPKACSTKKMKGRKKVVKVRSYCRKKPAK